MNYHNVMFGNTPYLKIEKLKRANQLSLMNVKKKWYTHFYSGKILYLAKILRALLSNINEILHF